MKRSVLSVLVAAGVVLGVAGAARADTTVTLGPATATAVGAWVKPTACSQFPVDYSGLPGGSVAVVKAIDPVTRTGFASSIVLSSDPRAGRVLLQICSFEVEGSSSVLVALEVAGLGVSESAPFAWSARPGTVRCVNKRTYQIREFTGKACPKGWVRR